MTSLLGSAAYVRGTTPLIPAVLWKTKPLINSFAMDGSHVATFSPPDPNPPPEQTAISIMPGMMTDYYNQIFVIPDVIDIRNPLVGQPQTYHIWNAFLEENLLQNIIENDTDGLTNSAHSGISFSRVQLKQFAIIVGSSAPLSIDSLYFFDFEHGGGQLVFRASRATVISEPCKVPLEQEYSWATNIIRSYNGSEQRISVRPKPRLMLKYNILLPTEARIREQKVNFFNNISGALVLPHWHEPFELTASTGAGELSVYGDFSIRDFEPSDFIYLVAQGGQVGELARILLVNDGTITFDSVLSNNYPIRSNVYPVSIVQAQDGSKISRYPVNAAELPLVGSGMDLRSLGGRGATIPLFSDRPLLDKRPQNNDTVDESFQINYDSIDFGNVFQTYSAQPYPQIITQHSHFISDRSELQFWKLFFDTVVGRRGLFYTPTFRNDLIIFEQPIVGGTQILLDATENYVDNWYSSLAHRNIMIQTADGSRQPKKITSATDNSDGTVTIILDSGLIATTLGSQIDHIEFLPLSRLGSDVVQFKHFGHYSLVGFQTITVDES